MRTLLPFNLFAILRLTVLAIVVLVLAFSFSAANHSYNAMDPPSDWPVLDAIASHDLNRLRCATEGSRIETGDGNKNPPLVTAILMDNVDAAKDLISRGADVNHASETVGSPLLIAADIGDPEITKLLIEHHADVNFQTPDGDTTLLAAVRGGNFACIDLLLASGADRYLPGARRNGLTEATASDETIDLVRHLLDLKFDPNWIGRDGTPPIVSAAAYDSELCVQALLAAGADPDLPDKQGRTARDAAKPFANLAAYFTKRKCS